MKRDGIASDHLQMQAAAMPQDELAPGLSGQPESIQPQALLAQVLDRANLQRALKQVRQNQGAPGMARYFVGESPPAGYAGPKPRRGARALLRGRA